MPLLKKTNLIALAVSLALAGTVTAQEQAKPADAAAAVTVSRHGDWQIVDTANFRVCAILPEAETRRLAETCQSLRESMGAKWLGEASDDWTPRCHIVLHPSAASYLREVGQGQQTAGSSVVDFTADKIIKRRIDLRGDHPDGYHGALAHEMTHVVLADRFIKRPIPRWADEGMAVLADSSEKQTLHLRDLRQSHGSGRVFRVVDLLTLSNYPQPSQVPAFYGQSLSLVDFLVARRNPQEFLRFVELAGEQGYDAALNDVYDIEDVADLETQWRRYQEAGELASLKTQPR